MSSGKIIAPAVAPSVVHTAAITSGLTTAATAAGVVSPSVGAAAAAVVLTRAAMSGQAAFGDGVLTSAGEYGEAQPAAEEWHQAVLDVIDRNSQIASMRAAHRRLDDATGDGDLDPRLPAPLNPGGRTLAELREWCDAVAAGLPAAEARLAEATIAGGLAWLATLPGQGRLETTARALAERQVAGLGRSGVAAMSREEGVEFAAAVDRIVAGLPADVAKEAYARVVEAGAQVLSATTAATARAWLNELRVRERHASEEAKAWRDGVRAAARYLSALRLEEISPELFPAADMARFDGVRSRLDAVVTGTAELTSRLRVDAEDAVGRAQQLAERCLIKESLKAAFVGLGYAVRDTSSPTGAELLAAGLNGWDDHVVTFQMSGAELHADFRRVGSDDVALIDPVCLERWRRDFTALTAEVSRHGVHLRLVDSKIPAGSAPAAVAAYEDAGGEMAGSEDEAAGPVEVRRKELPR